MRKIVQIALVCCLFALSVQAESLEGKKAPNLMGRKALASGFLKLRNLNRSLGYLKGADGRLVEKNGKYVLDVQKNVVVLNFFSTTCIPCIREIPTYNKVADKFAKKRVKLIYVNVDSEVTEEEMERFILKRKIDVPMMLANPREASRKYDVKSLPRIVVISPSGNVVRVIRGFNENLEQELSQIIEGYLTGSGSS